MGSRSDFLIVGGGIIGLSIAWFLSNQGASITVLERDTPGSGASGAAAGMLAPFAESEHGGPFVELGRRSLEVYDEFIAAVNSVASSSILNDSPGLLRVATTLDEYTSLKRTFETQLAAGYDVLFIDADEIKTYEPNLSSTILGAVHSPSEKQVDPRTLCNGLSTAIQRRRVKILSSCNVTEIHSSGELATCVTAGGNRYEFGQLIIAGGAWTTELATLLGSNIPIKPIKGQILSLHTGAQSLSHTIYGEHGYIVPRQDGKSVIGATVEDVGFNTDVTVNGISQLIGIAREYLAEINEARVVESWAGLRPASPDRLPILGKVPGLSNVFVATGHYRNGILLAPITGKLIADLVVDGKYDPLLSFFSPERFSTL